MYRLFLSTAVSLIGLVMKVFHLVRQQVSSNGRKLNEPLNTMCDVHMTVSVSGSLRLAKNFRSRTSDQSHLMKSVPGMTPAFMNLSRFGKMRDICPLWLLPVQTTARILHNGTIIEMIALLRMILFLTALRIERVGFNARMDRLQIPCFLVLSMFQSYKLMVGQRQRQPEIGNRNEEVTILTTKALIRDSSPLLAVIWLLRDISKSCPRSSVHPIMSKIS
jgi:hypothetical protein